MIVGIALFAFFGFLSMIFAFKTPRDEWFLIYAITAAVCFAAVTVLLATR